MDQDGRTALFAAARGSYDSVVKALVTAGANVNLTLRVQTGYCLPLNTDCELLSTPCFDMFMFTLCCTVGLEDECVVRGVCSWGHWNREGASEGYHTAHGCQYCCGGMSIILVMLLRTIAFLQFSSAPQ